MYTLTFIVIDTNTHSDTSDIICYMIVFWELNSYWWCNFKTFLLSEWNEKNWTVCHMWKFEIWTVCCVKKLHKLFMCEWNDEIWIIIVYVWTYLNILNRFSNKLNRFFEQILSEQVEQIFLWNFYEIWTDIVVVF